MSKEAVAAVDQQPLSWENLGAHPAGLAFRLSLAELIVRPARFFRRMATSGGLHEPITFFGVLMTLAVLLSLPAALAYVGLTLPDPDSVSLQEYASATRPARVAGLMVVVLPLLVVVGSVLMVLLGTLFHIAGKLFGSRNWEGSVSVWLYSASAALVPVVAAMVLIGAVSLVAYLLGIAWPEVRAGAGPLANWTKIIVGFAGLGLGVVVFAAEALIGCTQAFRLDPVMGSAAGLAGLLLAAGVAFLSVWAFSHWGAGAGLVFVAVWVCLAAVTALLSRSRASQTEGSA